MSICSLFLSLVYTWYKANQRTLSTRHLIQTDTFFGNSDTGHGDLHSYYRVWCLLIACCLNTDRKATTHNEPQLMLVGYFT